jgi:hypothetical protein
MNPKLKPLNHKQVTNTIPIKPLSTLVNQPIVTKNILGKPN